MTWELFDFDYGINDGPLDDTEITTTMLYFSKSELKQFKTLCKQGIKKEFNEDYQQKGNLSDFLLKILDEKYG
tara:strand:- start:227 stop:445 length:219 start_codon:yes stop_codon:yes gene_type:complete